MKKRNKKSPCQCGHIDKGRLRGEPHNEDTSIISQGRQERQAETSVLYFSA